MRDRAPTAVHPLIVVPLLAAAAVYYPIVHNYFREDDFVNLYFIENYSPARFLITVWAEHSLVTRNAIWWVLHAFVGTHPQPYFVLTFLTHLAAVGMLFEALRRLTGSATTACLAASLWGTAAVHEEAIGWFSVYGQLVGTVIVTWMLLRLADIRDGDGFGGRAMFGWSLLVLMVVTSFGVGLGIVFALPAIAFVLLPRSAPWIRLVMMFAVMAVVSFLLYSNLIALNWKLYGPFPHLPITAALSVPRALFKLLGLLAGNGIVALHAGPFAKRVPELGWTWRVLVGAWVFLVLVTFVRAPGSHRRVMLAGLALAFACYAALAGGRAPYFANGIEFQHEARYQYAATIGLATMTCVVLARVGARLRPSSARSMVGLVALVAAMVLGERFFAPPINHHVSERLETESVIGAIRAEVAKAPAGADVYIENKRFGGVGPLLSTVGMPWFPGWAAVFAIFFPDDTVDGRRVHFVTDPAIVKAGEQGRRSAHLLVPRDSRGAGATPLAH